VREHLQEEFPSDLGQEAGITNKAGAEKSLGGQGGSSSKLKSQQQPTRKKERKGLSGGKKYFWGKRTISRRHAEACRVQGLGPRR